MSKYDDVIVPQVAEQFKSEEAKTTFEYVLTMAMSYSAAAQGTREKLAGMDEMVQVLIGCAASAGFIPALDYLEKNGTLDIIRKMKAPAEEVPDCMKNWGAEGPIGRYD